MKDDKIIVEIWSRWKIQNEVICILIEYNPPVTIIMLPHFDSRLSTFRIDGNAILAVPIV